MSYAIVIGGVPAELDPSRPAVDDKGNQIAPGDWLLWDDKKRLVHGIFELEPLPEVPAGKRRLSHGVGMEGGVPVRTQVIEDIPADEVWAEVRATRNTILAASDWTQLADTPPAASTWKAYRQALRDITTQEDPHNIVWPEPPTGTKAGGLSSIVRLLTGR